MSELDILTTIWLVILMVPLLYGIHLVTKRD